jgi:hypothetical protein
MHNNKNKSEKKLTLLGLNNFGSLPDPLFSHPPAAGSSENSPKRLANRNLEPQYAMAILPSKGVGVFLRKFFSILRRIHDVLAQ